MERREQLERRGKTRLNREVCPMYADGGTRSQHGYECRFFRIEDDTPLRGKKASVHNLWRNCGRDRGSAGDQQVPLALMDWTDQQ